MRLSILLMMCLPSIAIADGIVPSLNEVPMFWGMLNNDPRYKEAAFKAQEAFFIQSGATKNYNLISNYLNGELSKIGKRAQDETAYVIDEYTPLSSKHVFFAAALSYTALVKKEVTQKFRNPVFSNVNHTLTVGQQHGSIGTQIPF